MAAGAGADETGLRADAASFETTEADAHAGAGAHVDLWTQMRMRMRMRVRTIMFQREGTQRTSKGEAAEGRRGKAAQEGDESNALGLRRSKRAQAVLHAGKRVKDTRQEFKQVCACREAHRSRKVVKMRMTLSAKPR